jgi:hypothetical protein
MDTILGVAVGVGLSAACGFRVFVPLLVMNLAALTGHLQLPADFAWMGSTYSTFAFGTATVVEVLGYYVPGIDHVLDVIATPAAVVAGTITTASMAVDLSPFLKWTLALIAGGGMAGLVQGTTVALRAKTSLATAGLGNPVISTLELFGAVVVALLAIVVPVLCVALVVILFVLVFRLLGRSMFGRRQTKSG